MKTREELLRDMAEEPISEDLESVRESLQERIDQEVNKTNMRKYHREVHPGVFIDVYDVINAFQVANPGTQHALKKLLAAGNRGYKGQIQDLKEAIVSINRAIELEENNANKAD